MNKHEFGTQDARYVVCRFIAALWKDRRGIALPMAAMMFVVLLAFTGLVLDGGRIYFEKRSMQFAADAGAFGGAHELFLGNNGRIIEGATNDTRLNGYVDGGTVNQEDPDVVNIEVHHPPTSGPHQDDSHVEVIISEVVPTYFMRVLEYNQVGIRARAVAGIQHEDNPICVLALDETDPQSLLIRGNAALLAPNCRVHANSSAPGAITVRGGSAEPCLQGSSVSVSSPVDPPSPHGFSGNEDCVDPGVTEGALHVPDPHAHLTFDDPANKPLDDITQSLVAQGWHDDVYDPGTIQNGDDITLQPGVFPNGVRMTGGNLNLLPGLYVVNGFWASGGVITGGDANGGVTIYNTGNGGPPPSMRGITLIGNVEVHLVATNHDAPASDTWCCDDIVLWNAAIGGGQGAGSGNLQFKGVSGSTLEGVAYSPDSVFDAQGTSQSSGWRRIVAGKIWFSGTPDTLGGTDFAGRGSDFRVALVE